MLNAVRTEQQVLEQPVLNIFYGSQTGNGERIAEELCIQAGKAGLQPRSQSLNQIRPAAIRKIACAIFVISTHGEGDPPDDALDLFEYLRSDRAPSLTGLKFAVLALGDSSYSEFCEAGRELERLLKGCGAKAFAERVECDLDYQEKSARWSDGVIEFGKRELPVDQDSKPPLQFAPATGAHLSVVPAQVAWSRKRPFPALVERVQKLTGLTSDKDVYHIELSLAGSGLNYSPGDSLGVRAFNDPELVIKLIRALQLDPSTPVEIEGVIRSLREWLTRYRELTRLTPDILASWAQKATRATLSLRLDALGEAGAKAFLEQRQLLDLAEAFPVTLEARDLVQLLRPLTSRSYSIASSQASTDDEVHLTVATLYSNAIGHRREGVASNFLNHRMQAGDEVGVFLETNRRFRLPEDRSTPLILVAAGTGIAPYRAFLQQLEEEGSNPDTWLIFGNPQLRSDFLYQREWLGWRSSGLLNRIDGAFSRDQVEKRYVQHIIREQIVRINNWLLRGAQIYICGGLDMGHAVEQELQTGISSLRGLNEVQSTEFISGLRRDRKILKDLY